MTLVLLILACKPDPSTPGDSDTAGPDDTGGAPPTWDAAAPAIDCTPGGSAPLLDAALEDAGVERDAFGYTNNEWNTWGDYVKNDFVLSWFTDVHHEPEQVPCFAGQAQSDLDVAVAGAHPVAATIGAWAQHVDVVLTGDPPDDHGALADVLARLPGLQEDAAERADALVAVDPELADALVPVFSAIADGVDVRAALDATAAEYSSRMHARLFNEGSGLVIQDAQAVPDYTDSAELDWFAGWYLADEGPRTAFANAGRRVAFAIEDADLARFAGSTALTEPWVVHTDAGALRISPSTDDTHDDSDGATLFELELGGDDTWTGTAGSTYDKDNPVSVVVDLAGADHYGYVEVPSSGDIDGALVSDAEGRQLSSGHSISASTTGRQGSGRWGIGMLFDLGGADDSYASLRMSQGYGSMGLGVLYDDGGDDTYAAEAGAQGAAVFGVGLLIDGGGDDHYTAWAYAQGFGYVGSGGLLLDAGDGADVYYSDPGSSFGGTTLYASPQLPNGEGNSSFTQGAGFGLRGDSAGVYLGGGFGMLRDGGGDDAYSGGVFSEGTGYWEGTGLLADAGGNDSWNALYYAEGGAAHFAMGILVDGGGDDQHNTGFTPYYMMLGAGHDYSVGVMIDESGNDTVVVPGLALGASNCQGRGVYVDNDGSDTYTVLSTYSTGLGNHSTECEARESYTGSNALFMDSGGDADAYDWPEGDVRAPADNSSFGIAWTGTDDEHGGAVDGDGETGFHGGY